jgi:hypothetical protein
MYKILKQYESVMLQTLMVMMAFALGLAFPGLG